MQEGLGPGRVPVELTAVQSLTLERRCAFIHRGRGLKQKPPEEQDAQDDGDGDDDDLDETHDARSFG